MVDDIITTRFKFKDQYLDTKGVIGLCSKYIMGSAISKERIVLMVYLSSLKHLDELPKTFDGYECEYIVCPEGIDCGCD
jgi:hypothetical protein